MKDKKNVWVLVGGGVVVVGLVVAFVWKSGPSFHPTPPVTPTAVYAPQGQLVAQFPKELILDKAVQVNSSYGINYSSSTNQYTATWNSSGSPSSLFNAYKSYFQTNGWTITNEITKYASSRGLYAKKASAEVGVAIVLQGKGSQVTVSYLAK